MRTTETSLPGSRYRATHQASVIAILGKDAPPVVSSGSQFYNQDRWVARFLIQKLCEWAEAHPGETPSQGSLRLMTQSVNDTPFPKRKIVIAATPDDLPPATAGALLGGGFHEALHSLLSRTEPLLTEEVEALVLPRWKALKDWSGLTKLLLEWWGIIEDIRIERRGNEFFPGIEAKMHALQDFILDQEEASRQSPAWSPLSTLMCLFRDLGLGYATDKEFSVIQFYRGHHPGIYELLVEGPFRPLLDEAIQLGSDNTLGSIGLAMDAVILLSQLSLKSKAQGPPAATSGCPQCGAPPDKLLVRPHAQTLQPIVLCTVCGHRSEGQPEKQPTEMPGDVLEGVEASDSSETDKEGEGKGEGEGEQGDGKDQGGEDSKGNEGGVGEADNSMWTPELLAEVILGHVAQGKESERKDFSSAMEKAFGDKRKDQNRKLRRGERPWRPFAPHTDKLLQVSPLPEIAQKLLAQTRTQTAFLQSRLRTMLLSVAMSEVEHGCPKGSLLSPRTLADTYASLQAREYPRRAFTQTQEGLEVSFAASVILDQSSSMSGSQHWLARCALALAVPLDYLGCPTLVAGFQDGSYPRDGLTGYDNTLYHRLGGVHIFLYKDFHNPLRSVLGRFGNIVVSGGTPMSDGMQFGLHALAPRTETHRVLFVITDGMPDRQHLSVITWQKRKARESGVHIVGIGIGEGALPIIGLFEDHVWAPSFEMMPQLLVRKLSSLLNPVDRRRRSLRMEAGWQTRRPH